MDVAVGGTRDDGIVMYSFGYIAKSEAGGVELVRSIAPYVLQ